LGNQDILETKFKSQLIFLGYTPSALRQAQFAVRKAHSENRIAIE